MTTTQETNSFFSIVCFKGSPSFTSEYVGLHSLGLCHTMLVFMKLNVQFFGVAHFDIVQGVRFCFSVSFSRLPGCHALLSDITPRPTKSIILDREFTTHHTCCLFENAKKNAK